MPLKAATFSLILISMLGIGTGLMWAVWAAYPTRVPVDVMVVVNLLWAAVYFVTLLLNIHLMRRL